MSEINDQSLDHQTSGSQSSDDGTHNPAHSSEDGHKFYGELAPWWPLISPIEDYEEEATFAASIFVDQASPLSTLLELGSGGGHCAYYLKAHAAMTLVDLAPAMLEVSKTLNPECRHVAGDMRTVRLEEQFDGVFVHDAIDYMVTEDDLGRVFETAATHCRPGGVAVFLPDDLRENFAPSSDHGGADGDDDRSARYLEWSWDPDPSDTWVQTEYSFVLRHGQQVHAVHESHRTGLFPRDTWLRLLDVAGFDARAVPEKIAGDLDEGTTPRELFVGIRR